MNSKIIGIILNDLDIPSYVTIVHRITINLAKYDYTTLTCDSQHNSDLERKNIRTVLSRIPEALIFSPVSVKSANISLLNQVLDKTIILDNQIDNINTNYISINHERAGYLSAKYMFDNNHSNIIILSGPKDFPGSYLYLKGIGLACKEYNLNFDDKYIFYSKPSLNAGEKIIMECFEKFYSNKSTRFTGVLSFCDAMAFGVYSAAKKLNLKIPEDISVIGYDDGFINDFTAPPLTTIHAPNERVASLCSELLISRLINKKNNLNTISLEPFLVERNSVKKIQENC